MGLFGTLKDLFTVDPENPHIKEIQRANRRARGMNQSEIEYASRLAQSEYEGRLISIINQLKAKGGNQDLIDRLTSRYYSKVYDYLDLLELYGYKEEDFDIKRLDADGLTDVNRYTHDSYS